MNEGFSLQKIKFLIIFYTTPTPSTAMIEGISLDCMKEKSAACRLRISRCKTYDKAREKLFVTQGEGVKKGSSWELIV
jgi:hypothetical protein